MISNVTAVVNVLKVHTLLKFPTNIQKSVRKKQIPN